MKKIILGTLVLSAMAFASEMNLKSCVGCHGLTWEKKALGKSLVVADMNASEIKESLVGYKNGTYGGVMKGVMKGQVAKYSDEELTNAAEKISDSLAKVDK